ncbi:MAG TPA: T9SS type A sorting domain-containing protein [bacterium]
MEVVTSETNIDWPKIAVDSSGNPYILTSKDRTIVPPILSYLILHNKNNGDWVADTFEVNAEETYDADLAIDNKDRIWCIYRSYDEIDSIWYLIVACKNTTGWLKDTVESRLYGQSYSFDWISIAVDSSGSPHIAYDCWTNYYPNHAGYYAFFDGLTWHKEIIDSGYNFSMVGYCCALDIDARNHPHISYFWHNPGMGIARVMHAVKNDSTWYYESVDSINSVSLGTTSIRVDTADRVGIAYKDPNTYQMKYAWHDGLIWYIDTVESVGGIRAQKALDMDSLGKPYIVYNNTVAYKDSTGWHYTPLPALVPPLTQYAPGALRISHGGLIHLSRLATNDDYTYREINYIYGTPTVIEENNHIVRNVRYAMSCSPNPFKVSTKIRFQFGSVIDGDLNHKVSLNIYDISGRLVNTLINDHLQNGCYSLTWNGRDEKNYDVSSGIYFCELKTMSFSKTIKLIILR